MRLSTSRVTAVFSVLLPLVLSQNPQTFWSDYPSCEEQCHISVYTSQQCSLKNTCGCGSASNCLCLADSCLCTTSSWLISVAQCIGQNCGAAAVTDAASIVSSACAGNGFNLAVPSTELVSAGIAAITTSSATPTSAVVAPTTTQQQITTTSDTPVTTSVPPQTTSSSLPTTTSSTSTPSSSSGTTSSPTPSPTSSSSSQPRDVLVGIIVPCAIAGVTLFAMLLTWLIKRENALQYFRNCCCCCCIGYDTSNSAGFGSNLRGNP